MLLIIVIRAVTLDGASRRASTCCSRPTSARSATPRCGSAAYGQVFFSLSIAFSIMIAYSSYLPRKTDLSNTGLIVGLSNAGFEFMAAIGVFAALGFLAVSHGSGVTEVAQRRRRPGVHRLPADDQQPAGGSTRCSA